MATLISTADAIDRKIPAVSPCEFWDVSRNEIVNRVSRSTVLVALFTALASGCGGEEIVHTTKGIDEKVSPAEFESFQSIINSLPDKKLPEIPSTLLPRPHWTQERTLPIQDLIRQENDAFEDRWSVELIARQLPINKQLMRALRREQMTPEQFVGLTLTLGAALTADATDERNDLAAIVAAGEQHVTILTADKTAFSSLSDVRAHEILTQAAWLTVVNRAKVLLQVPPENLQLVRKHREWLDAAFPTDLTQDPLADLTNVMHERGIPFEEMPESGSDEQIEWSTKTAIIGEISVDAAF
ncbi:hypothetical protein CA54_18420 [Symmachiella macrocystis]|uniref:Uncharacterized protein n=1 Tax=Symmachiella macrocystis TaxID=2527985 RepID=A0A5C6BP17_9PLAN|nr:hypothetical protein CA54_18420 [Symmachiella macrocystis]